MINFVKKIVKTSTFRQSTITTSGTLINGALGIIFYILMARYLGPVSFGIFFVGVTTISLISDIANLGTDTGIVNFVGRNFKKDKLKALKFLKLGLTTKIIASFVVVLLGWFLAPLIATQIFHKEELILALRLSLIGSVSSLLFSFSTSSIQAVQKFAIWSGINVSMNLLRLLIVVALFAIGILNFQSGLTVYILIPFLGFFISLFFLPKFIKIKGQFEVSKEFFKYNKWVAFFTIIAAVSSRLDTFMTTRFLSLRDVGIYSVAVNLAGVVPQIVFAIATVVAPKLTQFDTKKKVASYLKKLQLFVIGLALIGIILGIPIGYLFIRNYYGIAYQLAFTPFAILLIAQAIFLISIPVHTAVIYYFSYPKLFVWISLVNFLIIAVGGYILIPILGLVGASFLVLIGSISNFVIPAMWVVQKFK